MKFRFFVTLAVLGTLMSSVTIAQQTAKITSSNVAYLEYLPQGYNNNSNSYPLVISLHGIKEKGTTSNDPATLKSSVQKVANVGLPKYVKYGTQYKFILISPQLKSNYGTWPAAYVMDVINYAKKTLRVDPKRIYITGLSLGGFGAWTTLGAYPEVFAAALPICAGGNALTKACAIAGENVPVWGFHGDADNIVSYTVTTKMINAINGCAQKPNPLAKATLFAGMGHTIWDKVYNQTNALDWMLSYTNGSAPASTTESSTPIVSAGGDQTLSLPANSTYIQGSASDADGIGSYQWTKISGGSASLSGQTTSKVRAYNLVAGTYIFRLTAKDKSGNAKSDDVTVTVKSASSGNTAPVANAGSDKIISATSVKLIGSAKDSDGSVTSYKWSQYGGPSAATITNSTTSAATFSGLKAGKYYFRLTVKDNDGATDYDNVLVNVVSGTASVINLDASLEEMLAMAQ